MPSTQLTMHLVPLRAARRLQVLLITEHSISIDIQSDPINEVLDEVRIAFLCFKITFDDDTVRINRYYSVRLIPKPELDARNFGTGNFSLKHGAANYNEFIIIILIWTPPILVESIKKLKK